MHSLHSFRLSGWCTENFVSMGNRLASCAQVPYFMGTESHCLYPSCDLLEGTGGIICCVRLCRKNNVKRTLTKVFCLFSKTERSFCPSVEVDLVRGSCPPSPRRYPLLRTSWQFVQVPHRFSLPSWASYLRPCFFRPASCLTASV